MKIRELITVFGFKADEKALQRLDSRVTSLKGSLTKVALAGAAGAAALFGIAAATAKAGDEAAKQSKRLGLSVEAYQELDHVAKLGGTSIQQMSVGIRRLAQNMLRAKEGTGEAVKYFGQLGVGVTKADGSLRDTDEMLETVADRFADMPDGMKKTALASELFGRSGAMMIPMLNQGADAMRRARQEARDLGVVLSADAARQGEEFVDALHRLGQVARGLRNTVGMVLVPIITSIATRFKDWYLANQKLIKSKLVRWTKDLVQRLRDLAQWLKWAWERIEPIVDRLGGLEGVLRKVGLLLALYFGGKILTDIVGIGLALKGVLASFGLVGSSVAVVAVLLAIAVLAAEDFKVYLEGGDSAIGRMLKKTKGSVGYFRSLLELAESIKLLLGAFGVELGGAETAGKGVESTFGRVFDIVTDILRFMYEMAMLPLTLLQTAATETFTFIATWIEDGLGAAWDRMIDRVLAKLGRVGNWFFEFGAKLGVIDKEVGRSLRLDPGGMPGRTGGPHRASSQMPASLASFAKWAAPYATTRGSGGDTTLTAGGVTVTVNAGATGDPQAVGEVTSHAVEQALFRALRQASRTYATAEE